MYVQYEWQEDVFVFVRALLLCLQDLEVIAFFSQRRDALRTVELGEPLIPQLSSP